MSVVGLAGSSSGKHCNIEQCLQSSQFGAQSLLLRLGRVVQRSLRVDHIE